MPKPNWIRSDGDPSYKALYNQALMRNYELLENQLKRYDTLIDSLQLANQQTQLALADARSRRKAIEQDAEEARKAMSDDNQEDLFKTQNHSES
jgi:hypothetical protein